jgi:hypothetical protein
MIGHLPKLCPSGSGSMQFWPFSGIKQWMHVMESRLGKQIIAVRSDNYSITVRYVTRIFLVDLDQISYTIFFLSICALCKTGSDFWTIFLIMPPIFVFYIAFTLQTPHYSIEFRKHFTKIHVTVVGVFGATESLTLMMAGSASCGLSVHSNDFFSLTSNSLST